MRDTYSMIKMEWEEFYADGSGVEYAVRYDSDASTNEGAGAVEFESVGKVQIPQSKIDWLINCLQEIKQEQGL